MTSYFDRLFTDSHWKSGTSTGSNSLGEYFAADLGGKPTFSRYPTSALNYDLVEAIYKQLNTIRRLSENWDGYGAREIEDAVIDRMASSLAGALAGTNSIPPDIIPGGDGSVQAEWHLANFVLIYRQEPDGSSYLRTVQRRSGVEQEYFVDAENVLAKLTPRLASCQEALAIAL